MKILIVDDHAILRRGVKEMIEEQFAGAIFGEASTAQDTLEQVWKQDWHLALLDITMPGRSGLEVLREIKKARPKLPILVLSAHPVEQYAVRVLQAGASGYLTKLQAPEELAEAIRKVLAGGIYISPEVANKLSNHLRPDAQKPPHERLSNREFQVMKLLASGKSTKEIAAELCVSVQTVSTHRARTLKKMELATTAELIRYAVENKLLD
jgi:DNA-binding NarL/FixJ family response regulator